MTTTLARLVLLVPLCLALALVFGCSKRNPNAPASVNGKVTYKGAAVPAGTVTFNSKAGKYNAALATDGTYSSSDLPIGEMVVTVETESVQGGKKGTGAMAGKMSKMMGPVPDYAKTMPKGEYVKIPAKYSDPKTSPLKADLKDGKNEINFELTD